MSVQDVADLFSRNASIRYQSIWPLITASQGVFFAALAARLAHLYGEEVPTDLNNGPDFWRGLVSSYLEQPLPNGRLLVIFDGLDEATDWEAGADLFPRQPPAGLRVVVSARHQADDRGPAGWLRRLGWEWPGLANTLHLAPLTRAGVSDVLERMGFPLAELGQRVDIVAELHRLSEGDPLLVRLYVDNLWAKGKEAVRLRPEDLQDLEPGLEGYFDRWWEDQRKQWRAQAPLREPDVREVLNLLSAALAPLGRDDLLELGKSLSTWQLDVAIRPLARLVIGDGDEQGYTFSHPRLGQYFWERLSAREQERLDSRFLAWGQKILAKLKSGQVSPRRVSSYLVHALGDHLLRSKAHPMIWMKLVDEAWAAAGESVEGAYGLFAHDLDRAWAACVAIDSDKAAQGELAPYLGQEVRCALVKSSLHSLAGRLPPELVVQLVESGLWRPAQGFTHIQQMPNEKQRADGLAMLAPVLARSQPELLEKSLTAGRKITDAESRAQAIIAVAKHLSEPLRGQMLGQVLETARMLPIRHWGERSPRTDVLIQLVPHLSEELKGQVLEETLTIVKSLPGHSKYRNPRAEALINLSPHLSEALLPEALRVAQGLAEWDSTPYRSPRADALTSLAPHLTGSLMDQALKTVYAMEGSSWRVQALAGLAPYLPNDLRDQALNEALGSARSIADAHWRTVALGSIIEILPQESAKEVFKDALTTVQKSGDAERQARELVQLIPYLPEQLMESALDELLLVLKDIDDPAKQTRLLMKTLPHLAAPAREKVGNALYQAMDRVHSSRSRGQVLIDLIPHMPSNWREQALREALGAVQEMSTQESSMRALTKLAPFLPADSLEETLKVVQRVEDRRNQVQTLIYLLVLAPHMIEQNLSDLIGMMEHTQLGHQEAQALTRLLPAMPDHLARQTLVAVRAIEDVRWQVDVLVRSMPHLPDGLRQEISGRVLTTIPKLDSEWTRAQMLGAIAPYLSDYQHKPAIKIAQGLKRINCRIRALGGLASYLPMRLKRRVLVEALASVRMVTDTRERVRELSRLASQLPEDLLATELMATWERLQTETHSHLMTELLTEVVPHLPEGLLDQVLTMIRELPQCDRKGDNPKVGVLIELACHFPQRSEPLLSEALEAAEQITDTWWRIKAWVDLASHSTDQAAAERIGRRVMDTIPEIEDGRKSASILTELIPYLSKSQLVDALEISNGIDEKRPRVRVLARLLPHLSLERSAKTSWTETLAVAQSISRAESRTSALIELVPALPKHLRELALRETLIAIREIEEIYGRGRAIVEIVPHLPTRLMKDVLALIRDLPEQGPIGDTPKAEALTLLTSRLPVSLMGDALSIARELGNPEKRAEVLGNLAERMAVLPNPDLGQLWYEAPTNLSLLRLLSERSRTDLLSDITALAPIVRKLGGERAIAESFHATKDVGRWWP